MLSFLPCNRFKLNILIEFGIKLIWIGVLFPTALLAQNDYAITFKGDTLRGEIKMMSYDQIDRVQWSDVGQKKVFTALQVKKILKSGVVYEPVRFDNTVKFMEVLKPGFLTLYRYRSQSAEGEYLAKKDGTGMEVPNLNFKKSLAKYLTECPDVKNRLEKGEFNKRDLERIVDLYNICLGTDRPKVETPKVVDSEKLLSLKKLEEKIQGQNFDTKKDALDLIKDIQGKVSKNEPIPNYLTEGLRVYLKNVPTLSEEVESVIALLKK